MYMEIKIKQILEGWRNDSILAPKELKALIMSASNERLKICEGCELNSNKAKENGYSTMRIDYHCTNCGCPLKKKTKCLSCNCPIGKWSAVLTKEQEEELKKNV